jgi:hypothetical protein
MARLSSKYLAVSTLVLIASTLGGLTYTLAQNANERGGPKNGGVIQKGREAEADTCDVTPSSISWGGRNRDEDGAERCIVPSLATSEFKALKRAWGANAVNTRQDNTSNTSLAAVCAQAKVALQDLHANPDMRARMDDAMNRQDGDAVFQILADSGFDASVVPNVSFHAVNTKGTGAQAGRASNDPAYGQLGDGQTGLDHAVNTKGTGAQNNRVASADHAVNTKGTGAQGGNRGAWDITQQGQLGGGATEPSATDHAVNTKGTGAQNTRTASLDHAINTKGTGAQQGRTVAGGVLTKADAGVIEDGSYSVRIQMPVNSCTGHVTVMR